MRPFKVLLVNCNTMFDTLITAGIGILSSSLKGIGVEVELFDTTFYKTAGMTGDEARALSLQVKRTDFSDVGIVPEPGDVVEDFVKRVDRFKPDLVGLSCIEVTYPLGKRLLRALRQASGVPTIVGGPYATFAPEIVIRQEGVDMVCVGEGEELLVELCRKMRTGEDVTHIPNLWIKNEGRLIKNPIRRPVDLNVLPDQDWTVYDRRRFWKPMGGRISITGTFEMNRGCPYSCTFCINSGLKNLYNDFGGYYREKDVGRLVEEMARKKEEYGLVYVYLVAESFLTTSRKRVETFGRLYGERVKLPFWVEARPESITPDRVELLRQIGCEGISIGVESGSPHLRRTLLNRHVSNETIIRAFELLHRSKIRISANNIIGFPTETREMVFETIELDRILQPHGVMVSFFSPYKGCTLREVCELEGFIGEEEVAGDYRIAPTMDMPQLRRKELVGLQRAFPLYVKLPKEEWERIRLCEEDTPEGNALFREYGERYVKQFMS